MGGMPLDYQMAAAMTLSPNRALLTTWPMVDRMSELKVVFNGRGVYVHGHDRRPRNRQEVLFRVVESLDGGVRRIRSGSC